MVKSWPDSDILLRKNDELENFKFYAICITSSADTFFGLPLNPVDTSRPSYFLLAFIWNWRHSKQVPLAVFPADFNHLLSSAHSKLSHISLLLLSGHPHLEQLVWEEYSQFWNVLLSQEGWGLHTSPKYTFPLITEWNTKTLCTVWCVDLLHCMVCRFMPIYVDIFKKNVLCSSSQPLCYPYI